MSKNQKNANSKISNRSCPGPSYGRPNGELGSRRLSENHKIFFYTRRKEATVKKLLSLCLATFALMGGVIFADASDFGGSWDGGSDGYTNQELCCGEPQEHPCGQSYQLYCKYTPCYYNEWRTVCEPQCYQKKCCRYVPETYEKCCVKYVPQYYTQQCCRYVPQYYCTTETREVQRKVCDRKCKYVPKYFYKLVCTPQADCPAPAANACCPAPANNACCP